MRIRPGRIAVALACMAAAAGSGAQALSNVAAKDQPLLAARLSPYASEALARVAVGSLRPGKDQLSFDTSASVAPALEAFSREPLSTEAAAILAMSQETPVARHSAVIDVLRLTRRGRVLNFAALHDAMMQKDTDGTITSLNNAFLVYPGFVSLLMPTLIAYLSDPASIPQFQQVLETNPVWADKFFSASNIPRGTLENMGKLRIAVGSRVTLDDKTDRLLVAHLANAGLWTEALQLHERLTGNRQAETNSINWQSEIPPFDWAFVDKRRFYARPDTSGDSLRVKIAAGQGGLLASRIVRRPKEARILSLAHSLTPASAMADIKLSATCATSGTNIAISSFRTKTAELSLGSDACDWIVIAITGRAWSTGGAISGQVEALKFSQ